MDQEVRSMLNQALIYSEAYNIYGHWELQESYCELVFEYEGETVRLKTEAQFDRKTLPWLNRLAVLGIEDYVEQKQLDDAFGQLMAGRKKRE